MELLHINHHWIRVCNDRSLRKAPYKNESHVQCALVVFNKHMVLLFLPYGLGPLRFQGLQSTIKSVGWENYYLKTVNLEGTLEDIDSTLFTKIKTESQRGQETYPKYPPLWWQSWDQGPGFSMHSDNAAFTTLCCFSLKSSHRSTASLE